MDNRLFSVFLLGAALLCASVSGIALAQTKAGSDADRGGGAVVIDNGVSGDGAWQVEVGPGGDTREGILDAVGFEPENLVYDFFTYVDDGADGSFEPLSDISLSSSPTLTGTGEVTSSGSFTGPNGTIEWTAVATIPQGETIYEVTITFTSSSPFGNVRVINYFDQDVFGPGDDVLILLGTPGQPDFQMLTLDDTDDVGIGHFADYFPGSDATYLGFAADEYPQLKSAIESGTASFSVNGVIDTTSLPPITDPRFPGADAFGPADITGAYGFELDPTSTEATLAFALGGSISGDPVGPQPDPVAPVSVPTMSHIGFFILALTLLIVGVFGVRRLV